MKSSKKAASLALGMSLLGAGILSSVAMAENHATNGLFQIQEVSSSQLIAEKDAACGKGSCSASKKSEKKCAAKAEKKCAAKGEKKCSAKAEKKCAAKAKGEKKCAAKAEKKCAAKKAEEKK